MRVEKWEGKKKGGGGGGERVTLESLEGRSCVVACNFVLEVCCVRNVIN